MKSQRTPWLLMLLLVLGLALPVVAQDAVDEAGQDPPIVEDSVVGTWYVQFYQREVRPEGTSMRLVFNQDGSAAGYMREDEGAEEDVEAWRYSIDEKATTITIYDADRPGPGDIEVVLKYTFLDDMLVLRWNEGGGDETMELTRNPEGTERHQRMREEAGDRPSSRARMQSMTQMQGIHQGLIIAANSNKNIMPQNLGQLIIGDYLTPDYLLAPWSDIKVPDGFDDWEDQRKIDWGNTHTGYVFLLPGGKVALDSKKVVLLELPAVEDAETVALLFEDNHTETKPYAEADALIKEQTGHSIADWMKTTSPGTGQMVPEENAAADVVDAAAEDADAAVEEATE